MRFNEQTLTLKCPIYRERVISDKNHDAIFAVGEDLESGKWNNIILDLKQTGLGGVNGFAQDLCFGTNDFSTWNWDEAKTVYSPVAKLNISNIADSNTQLVNGFVRYKLANSSSTTTLYSWNFDTNSEGWGYRSSGISYSVSGGTLNITSASSDPWIESSPSLNIPAAPVKFLKIRMKNNSASKWAQLYWLTTNDGIWDGYKYKAFPINPNSDYTEYTIDVGSIATWKDTISQLRLDPGETTGTYNVDYIILQSQTDAAYNITPSVLTVILLY